MAVICDFCMQPFPPEAQMMALNQSLKAALEILACAETSGAYK
jgi:hypothetical protein